MNITLKSDRKLDVKLHMLFTDKLVYEARVYLDSYGPATFTVIGRWPKDLVRLELEHESCRFEYPIEPDSSGEHLKPISIYGGRDHWSQLLRNKAMEAGNGKD